MRNYVVVLTEDVGAVRKALRGIVPEVHIADVPVNPARSRFFRDTRESAQAEHALAVQGCQAAERYIRWSVSQMGAKS